VVPSGAHNKLENLAVKKLKQYSTSKINRIPTQFEELNRVLGGGIVTGGVAVVGGDPGVG